IRDQLLDVFGFERRELGQDVILSEAISTIQGVTGVAYVDVDAFGGVAEKNDDGTVRTPKQLLDAAQQIINSDTIYQRMRMNLPQLNVTVIHPAQLAYLTPDVPDTLILNFIDDHAH